MVLLNKQLVKVSGWEGMLAQVKHDISGTAYLKWVLVLGDETESVVISATFPKERERQLSRKLRASVLTSMWDRKNSIPLTEGLNFSITEKGELRITKRISNGLLFSKCGVFPSKDIDDPILVVAPSFRRTDIGDPEEFAQARVFKTAQVTDIEIESTNKVTIDTLEGYEIVAAAKDKDSGRPMTVFQVILFEEQGYFLIGGLVSSKNREPSLKVFREMANTFRRK